MIREANEGQTALRADLLVRGVWQPQETASFDIRVTDADAVSYQGRTTTSVLSAAENEKKRKYSESCQDRHISFTPLVMTADGAMATECDRFIRRIAEGLAMKWKRRYSQTIQWVRTRLAFAVVRATNVCVRGTRTKWRSLGIEDGASFSHQR